MQCPTSPAEILRADVVSARISARHERVVFHAVSSRTLPHSQPRAMPSSTNMQRRGKTAHAAYGEVAQAARTGVTGSVQS